MDDNLKEKIDNKVQSQRVMLFMKGTPAFPQCGFSNQAIQILRFHSAEFGTVNVLDDTEIRRILFGVSVDAARSGSVMLAEPHERLRHPYPGAAIRDKSINQIPIL